MAGAEREDSRNVLQGIVGASAAAGVAFVASVGRLFQRHIQLSLAVNVGLSLAGFWATTSIIEGVGDMFVKVNLKGIDLNKSTTKRDKDGALVRPVEGVPIPESQGTVCAMVFIVIMSVFIPSAFAAHGIEEFPHARLTEYLAAVMTITIASFLGFADDVLDLRWRQKIPLPAFATLPLLLVYHANGGETGVMVPNQLQHLLGEHLDLGIVWYLVLLFLAMCSTQVINMYAGVNGLEVGQSVVIGISVFILNVVQLRRIPPQSNEYRTQHLQSLFLVMPFLAVSLALWRLNWFPARVFVGDTYCYFAGMTLATICIVGHFSKTMIVFLIPQILNAVYSLPQLVRHIGIPCPRHRMPAYDRERGYVKNSYTEFKPDELPPCGKAVFWMLRTFKLAHVLPPDADGVVKMSNLTLINLAMYKLGSCREDVLCIRLLTFQCLCSCLCFALRFGVASYVFDVVL